MSSIATRSGKKDRDKLHLTLIATYPQMAETLCQIAEEEPDIVFHSINASFEKAADEAVRLSPSVDAILTRGGTGMYIKRVAQVPVTIIPISPFDLVVTLNKHGIRNQTIAFSSFGRIFYGMREIEEMFHVKVREYIFRDREDIVTAVQDAKRAGIKYFIGGDLGASLASAAGLIGIEIESGKEALHHAFDETIRLVRMRREEMNISARLQVAMDALAEGIIIVNEERVITQANVAARRLFNLDWKEGEAQVLGEHVLGPKLDRVFQMGEPIRGQIERLGDYTVMVNHLPVELEGEFIGVVSTAEDVTKIQKQEGQIRKKLYAKGFVAKYTFADILTENSKMQKLLKLADLYAKTMSTILIEGESGTGKEMLAQSIHQASPCADGPFVAVNCAAISRELLESELFGYVAGAFTGASKEGKAGLFELAHGGTIFLDEIGEIPPSVQATLLRVIQEKTVMRVGGDRLVPVNVRILSATNVGLKDMIVGGKFREDLFYRISVFSLHIPPLRSRKGDIPMLVEHFARERGILDGEELALIQSLIGSLDHYNWPGNIRELHNMLERICLLIVNLRDEEELRDILEEYLELPDEGGSRDEMRIRVDVTDGLKKAVSQAERAIIQQVLERNENDYARVMDILKIGRSTMWRKLNQEDCANIET